VVFIVGGFTRLQVSKVRVRNSCASGGNGKIDVKMFRSRKRRLKGNRLSLDPGY
jgi:hypothetical protein